MVVDISEKDYIELIINTIKLERLESGGVDDWEWYSDSLYPGDDEEYDEIRNKIKDEIYNKTEKGVVKHDCYLRYR
jgi:hypothetical protein